MKNQIFFPVACIEDAIFSSIFKIFCKLKIKEMFIKNSIEQAL